MHKGLCPISASLVALYFLLQHTVHPGSFFLRLRLAAIELHVTSFDALSRRRGESLTVITPAGRYEIADLKLGA